MEASTGPPNGRLDSWKEIAAYLNRGVRTVQRWERDEGLPVHRLPHEKRGTVYAYRHELDAWWNSRGASLTNADPTEAEANSSDAEPTLDEATSVVASPRSTWRQWIGLGSLLASTALVVAGLLVRANESEPPLTLQRVTTSSGRTVQTALSPDGKMVAYVSDGGRDGFPGQIWVQQIGSPTAIQLTHHDARHAFPSFSADGTRLVFARITPHRRDVFEIPALGGEPRLLIPNVARAHLSPDGKSIAYVGKGNRLYVASADGTLPRDVAGKLIAVREPVWSPDATELLVTARGQPGAELDWWVVPVDGGAPIETRLVQALRDRGFNEGWLRVSPVWPTHDEIVFSGRNRDGWSLWRQRFNPATFAPLGEPQRITTGTTVEWWPSVAAGRLAFVSSHPDNNLWSLPADTNAGTVTGPLRRLTRGSGVTGYPSLSADGRVLAFASDRAGDWDISVKDLATGTEKLVAGGPDRQMYSALTPDGTRVAFGVVVEGSEVKRPVFIATVADGTIQKICDDCNGRPRLWLRDARHLVLQRIGRFNSIAAVDTTTGAQLDLLVGNERAVSNVSVSSDGRWAAFEVSKGRFAPATFVARLNGMHPIPESDWVEIEQDAALPFWSPDGRLLYYVTGTTIGPQMIRAQRFDPATGRPVGEAFDVFSLEGTTVPAFLTSGAGLIASRDEIVLTLGEFRGDVWMTNLRK